MRAASSNVRPLVRTHKAIALCAALNFAIGNIVYLVKLPIYLDSIGTILCALLIFPDRRAAFICASIAVIRALPASM